MNEGERIGRAWQAALDRLPEGWQIDQLKFVGKGMAIGPDGYARQASNVWRAHAAPSAGFAWGKARHAGNEGGYNATGFSPVEALLALAVRAEGGLPSATTQASLDAVDRLFNALFGEAA